MSCAQHRHDISDHVWSLLEPHLPGKAGSWGGVAQDNRRFINAVFWILRTGAPWRDLPPDYGDWKNTHRRFCRWRDKGIWEGLLERLVDEPDYEWLTGLSVHGRRSWHRRNRPPSMVKKYPAARQFPLSCSCLPRQAFLPAHVLPMSASLSRFPNRKNPPAHEPPCVPSPD